MDKYVSADTIWVLIGAFLVFSMQPGFAMVETGFTRAKNAGNIVMKNVMDMCLGSIVFWVLGFGLMFGTDIGGFINPLMTADYMPRWQNRITMNGMAFIELTPVKGLTIRSSLAVDTDNTYQ